MTIPGLVYKAELKEVQEKQERRKADEQKKAEIQLQATKRATHLKEKYSLLSGMHLQE
jgi:hypothetical protein